MTEATPKYWTKPAFRWIPPLWRAENMAEVIASVTPAKDVFELATELDIPIRLCELAAKRDGLQACLVPDFDHPFEIFCDTWSEPGQDDPIPKRIAHELGHTFFYDWTKCPPTHVTKPSTEEEEFCNRFATELVARLGEVVVRNSET